MALKVGRSLGTGGYSHVEEVFDGIVPYARKTFRYNHPPNASMEANAKARFIKEARYQASIIHRNIVPIIRTSLNDDPPSYLMPVAEATLEDDMIRDRSLGNRYVQVLMDVLAGLEEMHSVGMTHRDLKPKNVLRFIDSSGVSYYAIGDFGLLSVEETSVSSLTTTGMQKGSDMYTAPEIVKKLKNASAQSDIYSVGCILHDIVGTSPRIPLLEIKGDTSPFAGIILRCTRTDPKRRFKSVAALRDALLLVGHHQIPAKSESAKAIIQALEEEEASVIPSSIWNELADYLEDEREQADYSKVLHAITSAHVEFLVSSVPVQARRIGSAYAEWVRTGTFSFGDCDGLGSCLRRFFELDDLTLKSECCLALLYMGTSHNRWYVERIFFRLVGADLDANLARRLAIEFRAEGGDICRALGHLEHSINVDLEGMHPTLHETYRSLCGNANS